jgi:23S rRNA pseudouridine1911/1915/1917 synthase
MINSMSQSFRFHVTAEDAGCRLDEFLASRFGSLSRMRIANLVSAGACTINRSAAQRGWRVAAGDLVEIAFVEGAPTAMEPDIVPLEILYEDEHFVVVVKPAGMLVHPTMNVKRGTLANALAYHLNRDFYNSQQSAIRTPAHGEQNSLVRPGLVHRLDRATSGLMVIASTAHALSRLSRHFQRRLIEKRYLALADGLMSEDAGEMTAPIGRDDERRPRWWVTEGGKTAVTRFNVRERFDRATLVELEPVTGRTNQLRIHCAYYGHPILGDELYESVAGDDKDNDSPITEHRPMADSRFPQRLCLHAWRLAFHHPVSGEWMEFTSPLPDDMARFIDSLQKQSRF